MDDKLQVIVKESGLEKTKASVILEKFQDYFKIADEWEQKAKTIKVVDESQTADMQMARIGRLFLKDKRMAVEKTRKELKEQALREGKAIDGIANVLKALIVPIEEYLDKQEHFVELKEAAEEAERRVEVERRMEEERIAEEKAKVEAEAKERERIRLENIKLKKEAEAKEILLQKERKKAKAERHKAELKLQEEREKAEKERKIAQAEADKFFKIEQEKQAAIHKERDRKLLEQQIAREEAEAKAAELLKEIECPYCHKKFKLGNEVK
ncbi:MAG TPA: hypothetical protein ENH82_06750 [bacterium]|nr:hypothetical protein [bacterium]